GVAAERPRRGEVHTEAAAAPQAVAGQRDCALHPLLLDLAVRGATNRRRHWRGRVAVADVWQDPQAVDAKGGANVFLRRLRLETGDRDVVVLLERQPDGLIQAQRARLAGDANPRRQRLRRRPGRPVLRWALPRGAPLWGT